MDGPHVFDRDRVAAPPSNRSVAVTSMLAPADQRTRQILLTSEQRRPETSEQIETVGAKLRVERRKRLQNRPMKGRRGTQPVRIVLQVGQSQRVGDDRCPAISC